MQLVNWKWKGGKIIALFRQVGNGNYILWESSGHIAEKIGKAAADEWADLPLERRMRTRKLELDEWMEKKAETDLEYFTEGDVGLTELPFGPALMLTAEERSDIATLLRPASEEGDVTGIIRNWNEMRQTLSKKLCYER